jgi:hypothetical protein
MKVQHIFLSTSKSVEEEFSHETYFVRLGIVPLKQQKYLDHIIEFLLMKTISLVIRFILFLKRRLPVPQRD